jgi:hypothetical protein
VAGYSRGYLVGVGVERGQHRGSRRSRSASLRSSRPFISGINASFLDARAVAVAGALIALLTRRGQDRTHGH